MIKVSTWLPVLQLEEINRVKGDISTSLFIRRAIQKATDDNNVTTTTLSEGDKVNSHSPKSSSCSRRSSCHTNNRTHSKEGTQRKEVEG
jgi:hypothetical protein